MYLKKLPPMGDRQEFLIRRYCNGKILNVGCGETYIREAVNLDAAREVEPDVVADFHGMPFPDDKFDTVLAHDVIEHTKKPTKLVNEIQRVAKPDGTIIIACNNFDVQPQNWDANPDHVTYFNEEIFRNFFEPKGFSCFSLYRGVLVATNNPKPFNKILSMIFALYKRPVNMIRKLIEKG